MKHIFLVLFVCVAFRQQSDAQIDSLKNLLQLHPQEDSTRVDALVTLSKAIVPNAPDEAKRYANEGLHISRKIGWQQGIARSLRMLGYCSYITADFLNAVDFNLQALQAVASLNDKKLEGSIFNNMGLVYSELSEFDKALQYYDKYLAVTREQKTPREQAIALMNIGLVHFKNNNQPMALDYYQQSLTIAEPNEYQQVIAYVLSNTGATLNKKGDYKEALASFQKSIAVAGKIGDARIMLQSLGGVGESYFHLMQYDKAETYTKRALQMAREIPLLEYEKEMNQGLSEIYTKQQNFAKAFETYKTFVLIRDSILNDTKRQELRRLEMQYEFQKKEAMLKVEHETQQALAASEIRRQNVVRNSVMGGAAVLLLAAAFSFMFYKKRRDADERTREAEFSAKVSDTEMKALRSQMNPHFIFNSLNSIGDYISKNDIKSADYYLAKFAKLMRLILEHSERKEVSLADDLQSLELYLQLESLRLNNKFKYEIIVDDAIDKESTMVPPLLLQPFVENSIWHGIAPKAGEGTIRVRIVKEDGMINCIVEDDGVGRKQAASVSSPAERQSLGMKITNARIEILNAMKQTKGKVLFSDLPEGMRVEVTLPLVLQF